MYLILFNSDSHMVRAEKILTDNDIEASVIPLPRDIGCNCNSCLSVNKNDMPQINDLIEYFHIRFEDIVNYKN